MMTRFRGAVRFGSVLTLLVSILVTGVPTGPARAQDPVTGGLILLGGKAVGGILNDAEKKATNLIDRAGARGDLVGAHGAAELQLMVANLKVLFADSEKTTFDQLTKEQQRLFTNLNQTIERIQEGGIAQLPEMMDLVLGEFTIRAGLAKPSLFYVSSIRGTTLVEHDHDYEIRVAGLGFGYKVKGGEIDSVVDVTVNGKDLDFGCVQQQENHVVLVKIPAKRLQKEFKDDMIVKVPFTFRATITDGKGERKSYEVSVPLILMPRFPGSITVEERVEEKVWGNPQTKTITLTRNVEGQPKYREEKWTCKDGERITAVKYVCTDRNAGFSYAVKTEFTPGKSYDADYDITDGAKTAVVRRKLDTFPLTASYDITYETLSSVNKDIKNGDYRLKYDEPLEVLLAPNNGKGNFKITGKLFDGRKINSNSEIAPTDHSSPLRLVGVGSIGDRVRATFVLKSSPSTP